MCYCPTDSLIHVVACLASVAYFTYRSHRVVFVSSAFITTYPQLNTVSGDIGKGLGEPGRETTPPLYNHFMLVGIWVGLIVTLLASFSDLALINIFILLIKQRSQRKV